MNEHITTKSRQYLYKRKRTLILEPNFVRQRIVGTLLDHKNKVWYISKWIALRNCFVYVYVEASDFNTSAECETKEYRNKLYIVQQMEENKHGTGQNAENR